jgi:hypothetical protein
LHAVAVAGAWLFYPLAWTGILVAARGAWRLLRTPQLSGVTPSISTARDAVMGVVLVGLGLQALLFGLMRIPAAPQYFFGTFALHAMAAWLAVDALRRWKIGPVLGMLYATGGAVLTLEAAWSIHQHGYERPLWPTLASSVRVARALNHFADPQALTDVAVYQKSPQALRTLRLLLPPVAANSPDTQGRLLVTNRGADRPGETTVIELPPDAAPPAGSQWIEITPLPKDWVPDPATW